MNEYKSTIVQNDFSSSMGQSYLNKENERIIGSSLAHNAINNIPNYLPYDNNNPIIIQGHGKADNAFTTNQSSLYFDNNISKTQNSIRENVFYLQGEHALKNNYYDQAISHFGKAIEVNSSNHNIYLDRAYAYLQNGQFDQSLNDYQVYNQTQTNVEKSASFVDCFDFSVGVTTGIAKGAVESGKQLISFAANAITHPINTGHGVYVAFSNITKLTCTQEWQKLSQMLAPEVCELINSWENLSPKERGEKAGYIVGKYGTDIFMPGAAAKAISQGVKGAKELAILAKNLQRTEELVVLEALAGTGGGSGAFAETVYAWKTTEEALNATSKFSQNITKLITSKKIGSSKKLIDSLIKETFENKGCFVSKYGLTYNEALDAGLKFLGKEYKEIGKSGSGVYRSADGLRQFRIDKTSITGNHSPNIPHFHLEILEEGAKKPIAINHIILLE